MDTTKNINFLKLLAILFVSLFLVEAVQAQYFGRNRPSYKTFDFQVYESPNFTIYHYFENDSVINAIANNYEKWYLRHSRLFKDTFEKPSPIIMYQNHPDFQQTRAVGSMIGVGTQGVTEALKNRVIMPVLPTNAQTNHVIGHELVHVFHFRALFIDDSLSLSSLRNLPLWLVEGMAEYFSIGSTDSHTAMIMRDAVVEDDFPSLRDMTRNYEYNPYRYGHAFTAFVGRTWGDTIIAPLFRETAKFGYERAVERVIGLQASIVSDLWKSSTISYYTDIKNDGTFHGPVGDTLVGEDSGGRMNIAPSISPDGKNIAFFSERGLFTLDLFLADAETGEIIRRLSRSTRDSDIDGFNFLESVGTWSPDGKQFVHVAVKRGRNQLVVVDVNRPRRTKHISVEGIPSLNNPNWSPDGRYMVFSGLVEGIDNLYMLDMETKEVQQLTHDRYSHIQPHWSPDGKYLTFSTDILPERFPEDTLSYSFNLAIMDMQTPERNIEVLDVFPSAENLNPLFDSSMEGIYFLSNRDGYRNLYYYSLQEGKVFQLTRFFTGISGITHLSPAVSISRETGELAYTHFSKGVYSIYKAGKEDFLFEEVDPQEIDMVPALLPPLQRSTQAVVDGFFEGHTREPIFPVDSFLVKEFRPQFGLSFIGSSGVGVSTNRFGTGMAGGVAMSFSDIVGDHQLFTVLAVNGEIYDFGGQVGYLNQKGRIKWGATASHIPYPYAYMRIDRDIQPETNERIDDLQFVIRRTFEDQAGLFAFYPISVTRRVEVGGSIAWYYFREDIFHTYYVNGFPSFQDRSRGDVPSGFNLQRLNIGYIGDNSFFGMASPMAGHRYRFSLEKMFGRIDMYNAIADYRQYFYFQPFSIAMRGMHYGRYGSGTDNNIMYPLFLGFPGFMRGYDYGSLFRDRESFFDDNFTFDNLIGTRMFITGLELKVPFTGPERLALISSNFFFTELALFLDGGIAWDQGSTLQFEYDFAGQNEISNSLKSMDDQNFSQVRFPLFSTGVSIRVNVFGAIILEPYYAFRFIPGKGLDTNGVWGLNFVPGW